jgi:tRNA threonylcarbamoyl adenosine modification protein YjeE
LAVSGSNRWWLPSAADTVAFGRAVAVACSEPLDGPRLLYLSGELGAGKTMLAAALLAALGVNEVVRSPSYALVETYPIAWGHALHLDCYRLADAGELEQLGLRDQHAARVVWVVEWPERAIAALPRPDLWLRLSVREGGREAECEPKSGAGASWLARLLSLYPYVANKT